MHSSAVVRIRQCSVAGLEELLPGLVALVIDVVASGASVGFLPPLSAKDAEDYWRSVASALAGGNRVLLIAMEQTELVGAVQLDLAAMPNGLHRAEVMKLFVLRSKQRRGIGAALLRGVEEEARRRNRSLLVLDTRSGDSAERLYARAGYVRAGVIPRYARSASGALDDTILMYRWLDGSGDA